MTAPGRAKTPGLKRNRTAYIFATILILAVLLTLVLFSSFRLSGRISENLRDSAYDSLMDSSEIIRQNIDSLMALDMQLISSFADLLLQTPNDEIVTRLRQLCDVNKLYHAYYWDNTGMGVCDNGEAFDIDSLPVENTARYGVTSVSTGYMGDTGQMHILIQAPLLSNGAVVGGLYAQVVATRYYSDESFSFAHGEGRASLINRTNGAFVIKAPQTSLAYMKADNIFDAISSANDEDTLGIFTQKLSEGAKAIVQMQYGEESSYIAILPCQINQDLYVATIISRNALQVQADSINRLMTFMQLTLIAGFTSLFAIGSIWAYRDMRARQAQVVSELARQEREKHLTKLQNTQEELRIALIKAQEANVAKTQFLSNMSHDIRTPMNAIIGMTSVASNSIHDEEKVRDCLSVIASSSHHLLGLISDILDMSKIESGKLSLANEPFALPVAIESVTTIISPLCRAKDQDFEIKLSGIKHEFLIGDKIRVNQVLMNLLNNANKFTPTGGRITLTVEELPSPSPGIASFRISVADNGIGIANDKLGTIFDAFVRSSDSAVMKTEGAGLGLAISKSIVTAMGGTISVESELGMGTTFTAMVSFQIEEDSDMAQDYVVLSGMTALVVDDEYSVCRSTCDYLDDAGMITDYATSGQQAVVKVLGAHGANEDFNVILVDWKMPGMDGVETIRLIRQVVGSNVPVIILTAYDWREIESAAREAGANAFLSKPLFRSSLYQKLAQIKQSNLLGQTPAEDLSGKHVLLVDDNTINQLVAVKLLESYGLKVDTADNGQESVDAYVRSPAGYYDAILMDIQMPVMDGYDAARHIRSSSRSDAASVPIIAMTANAFPEDVEKAHEAGMNEHLSKPIDTQVLFSTLKKYMTK